MTESFTLLYTALYFGILLTVENILLKKGLINKVKRKSLLRKRDHRGNTALHWVVISRYKAIVRLLLENGANINAKGEDRNIVLLYTIKCGLVEMMRLLLEKGVNTNGGVLYIRNSAE